MAQADWKNVLKERQDLHAHLELEKVLASRDGQRIMVCFLSDIWIGDRDYAEIKRSFKACFPGSKVSVRIANPQLKEDFAENPGKYWGKLAEMLGRKFPSLGPVLAKAELQIADGAVVIVCENAVEEELLRRQGVPARLEEGLRDIFRADYPVRLNTRETREIARNAVDEREKREREAYLALQAASASAPAKPGESAAARVPGGKRMGDGSLLGKVFRDEPIALSEVREDSGTICALGEIVSAELRELRGGRTKLLTFLLTDFTNTFRCKAFLPIKKGDDARMEAIEKYMRAGNAVKLRADVIHDDYERALVLKVIDMQAATMPGRVDSATEKRVELHAHTQMSAMDAVVSASDLVKQAAEWGHPAIGITDHGVVQAFPEAFGAAKKHGIKVLPGCEIYLLDDYAEAIRNPGSRTLDGPFVVYDVETTGFSPRNDRITEIGALRYENGDITGRFQTLINPGRSIPHRVQELTGITDGMVATAPPIEEKLEEFLNFCEGATLVAHNAPFDMSFLEAAMERMGLPQQKFVVIDTLAFSRFLYPELASHRLGRLAKHIGFNLEGAHRADNDAEALLAILRDQISRFRELGLSTLREVNERLAGTLTSTYHTIVYAKNQKGLRNLYELVSLAHVDHFGGSRQNPVPRVPRSDLIRLREGLLVGSACEAGELFRAVLSGAKEQDLERIAKFYDYLEVQPIGNNAFLIRNNEARDENDLRALNKRIVDLGARMGKPVVATCDVHFLHPRDEVYRRILMAGKGFKDADEQAPLYLHTTTEMLEEFSYLGEEKAREIVIDNPRKIADSFEEISLFPEHPEGKETFQPFWPDAADKLEKMVFEKAHAWYGEELPDIVTARLKKELDSIVGNGFSTLYMIAHLLVKKSVDDGYLVGSRGSVGSSFVATMMDITEVNPLPTHYRCTCHYHDFSVDAEQYKVGTDLPHKDCPVCGKDLIRDGFDIPFEVFLGFFGDKVPDIDLNFSGEYQSKAHDYVEVLFGEGHTFRAGTIGTLADKTAFGFVKKYHDERSVPVGRAETDRLVAGCVGTKRTTGQHPGGIVVLPEEYEIYQFTPIQRPADDMNSATLTTHFDFNSLHDRLLKLDILGHDDPTMIHMLEELTGINARQDIDISDEKVMGLFRSPAPLGLTPEELGSPVGTLGVPEFGTRFVRSMLVETQPTTMSELVRIAGLSHGTDVWLGNAQDLIRNGTTTLNEAICTRDDIMNALIERGVEDKMSFDIMESVRKGKGLTEAMEAAMMNQDVPDWFIESCRKIKYMFPKAHAVAYVMMSLRVAWFKVYYPREYYTAYYTVRADDFDAALLMRDIPALSASIKEFEAQGKELSAKDCRLLVLLEIVREMLLRGIAFAPIDLYESDALRFRILDDGRILPPLNSVSGLGDNAALAIAEARKTPFLSWEDIRNRAHVSKTVVETLAQQGVLEGLSPTSQLSLFGMEGMGF